MSATTNEIKITSRSGSFLQRTGTFDFTYFGSMKSFDNETKPYKTDRLTFSISFNPAYLSYDKKIKCVKNWTMYYYTQNKNGTWKKQWQYISCDDTAINNMIGESNRVAIETELHDELLNDLTESLSAIQNTFPQYYATTSAINN